jgi:hypothetical protein
MIAPTSVNTQCKREAEGTRRECPIGMLLEEEAWERPYVTTRGSEESGEKKEKGCEKRVRGSMTNDRYTFSSISIEVRRMVMCRGSAHGSAFLAHSWKAAYGDFCDTI